MSTVNSVCQFMDAFAPRALAEDWDNVGLLIGDRNANVKKVMTCLTVTPESVAEAIEESVDLLVTHHPIPFQPLKKITTDNTVGRLILDLVRHSIAVYSPHTGFDSGRQGINQSLAERLALTDIEPILPNAELEDLGSGRMGRRAVVTLGEFAKQTKMEFGLAGMHVVGDSDAKVEKIAVACGSGGSFLAAAGRNGCDTLVTGETNFHTCLEAKACSISLVMLGHFGSERFAVEWLAKSLATEFTELNCWASFRESDPVSWL